MISTYKPETGFYAPERCHIVEIHNRNDGEACSIAQWGNEDRLIVPDTDKKKWLVQTTN